jgi:hypothetical protein
MQLIWDRSQAKLLKIGIEQSDYPDRIEMPREFGFSARAALQTKGFGEAPVTQFDLLTGRAALPM